MNLIVHEVKTKIDTMNGAAVPVKVAVAKTLMIGGLRLQNVAFYVLPDKQPPFDSLKEGHQGILGLPVMLAMNCFSWSPTTRIFKADVSSQIPPNLDSKHCHS
jgi:hypothetical protein